MTVVALDYNGAGVLFLGDILIIDVIAQHTSHICLVVLVKISPVLPVT